MPGHRSAPGGRKCAMIPRRPHATAPPIYSSGVPDPGGPPERRDSRGPPNLGPFAGAARLRGQPGRGRFAAGPHRRLQPPAGPRLSAAGRDGARDKLPPSCLRGPLWVASHGACWAAWQRFGQKKKRPRNARHFAGRQGRGPATLATLPCAAAGACSSASFPGTGTKYHSGPAEGDRNPARPGTAGPGLLWYAGTRPLALEGRQP